MSNPCLTCKFADWYRTSNGRLHPGGMGRCTWTMPVIALPKSRYWVGREQAPMPAGGYIERRDERDCPTYEAG